MRKIALLLAISLMFLTACGTKGILPKNNQNKETTGTQGEQDSTKPSESAEAKIEDYFPFSKDVHMKYRGEGNEYAEFETYVDYVKDDVIQLRKINPGTISVSVYKLSDGVLKEVFTQGEVYYRHDFTSQSNKDEIVIKEPIKEGTSWTLSNGSTREITAVDKDIKTPAGDYKALEITTKNSDSVITNYYVKDIGLVKTEFRDEKNTFTIASELEKQEKGIPLKQVVRFFYPEFSKDRVVYIDKEIELTTNQDPLPILEKELKTVPEGSELTKVLTPNTKILGYGIDEKEGTIAVDFSSNLVTEMNAGSGLEMMIIKSLTNTFGRYYQKDKVVITLDGKLYESGHILLGPGEHFTVNTENITDAINH